MWERNKYSRSKKTIINDWPALEENCGDLNMLIVDHTMARAECNGLEVSTKAIYGWIGNQFNDICYSIAYPVLGHKIDGFEINPNDPKYILRKRDRVFVKMIDESTMQKYENPSNLEVVVY